MGLVKRLIGYVIHWGANCDLSKKIVNRLNKAFNSYVQAYGARQLRFLTPYFSRPCIQMLAPSIYNEDRFFASDKFRKVDWELVQVEGSYIIVRQCIEFDKIRTSGFKISIANSYGEEWIYNERTRLIEKVGRAKC